MADQILADIKKEVLGVHEAITSAALRKDLEELGKHLSRHFSTEGGDYNFSSGAALVGAVKNGDVDFHHIRNHVVDFKLLTPESAVVVGRRELKGRVRGNEFNADFPLTALYTRESGQWKAALWAVGRPEQEPANFTA